MFSLHLSGGHFLEHLEGHQRAGGRYRRNRRFCLSLRWYEASVRVVRGAVAILGGLRVVILLEICLVLGLRGG